MTTFEERCREALSEPVYRALLTAHAVELSSDGYQMARCVAAALLEPQQSAVLGWLRADGSFSEQWPMNLGERVVLAFNEEPRAALGDTPPKEASDGNA